MAEDVRVILGVDPSTESNVQGWFSGKEFKVKLTPEGEFAKQLEASLQAAQENASRKAAGSVAKNLTSAQEKAAKAWEAQQKSQITAWAKEQIKAEESVQKAKEKADKAWAAQQAKQAQELAKAQAKAITDAQKQALSATNGKTLSNNMANWLKENTQYAEKYGSAINDLQRRLSEAIKAGDSAAIKQIGAEFRELQSEAKLTSTTVSDMGKALKQALGGTVLGGLAKAGVALAARELRKAAREMVESAIEIESALAQLQVVTGASGSQLDTFFERSAESAKQLGVEVKDMLGSVETFSRLGYGLNESLDLSKWATVLGNIANMDVSDATTGITSIIKGWGKDVADAENIADVISLVGKNYAIASDEIVTAAERSGAALNAAGTSFEKSVALFAAANASVQNAQVVGTALKTISARITKSTADLEELGEDYSDLADGMSKYREEIKAMSGVDIMINDNTYKDVYDIFKELSQVWDQLSQTQQARISEILGGTRGLTVISSIMQNFGDAEAALADATNAMGTAAKANDVVMDTTEKKIEQLKTSAQVLARDVLSSDLTKSIVDFGTKVVDVIDSVVNKFGALPVAIGAIVGIDLIKNLGSIIKLVSAIATIGPIFKTLSVLDGRGAALSQTIATIANQMGMAEASATSFGAALAGILPVLGAIAAAIAVIGVSYAIWDHFVETFDEAAQSADEARQKYEQTQSDIQSIQSELKTTGDRIDELNAKGGLTLVEQDELAKLYDTESSLERQLAYKQQIAQVEAEAAANAARSALENEGFMAFGGGQTVKHGFWNDILYSVGQSMAMSTSGQMAPFDGGKTAELVKENQSESVNIIEATIRKQEALNDLQERQGEIIDHNSEEYKNNQDQIAEFATQISDNWNLIDQYRQSIVDAGLAEASGFKEIIEQIDHLEKLRAGYEERGEDGQWVLTELGKRAEALEKVQSFLSKPTLSGSFDALREALSNKHDLSLYAIMAQFPELTAAAQAAGVNIIDVINSIKSEMGLLDFDEVRKQLKSALDVSAFSSDNQKWLKEGWSNWIDSLSGEEIEILYGIKQSNDTSSWTFADWQTALENAKTEAEDLSTGTTAILEEMSGAFDEASEAASKFYTALSESASGTGLSSDSIQAIKDMFSGLDGYNAFELFEKTTTGVRLNTQALEKLNDEYERHKKVEMQNQLEALIQEYNSATDALLNCAAGTQEYNDALANVNGLEAQIESALELQAQYEGLTSAYNKFLQAQSSGDNRDAYANIGDSYKNVEELINLGWVSDSEVTEYLDLMLAASARTGDVYNDFDRLTQKIAGTDFSIMDFFQYDEDTEKLTTDGLYNFLDAVDALDDSLVQIGDDGSYAFDWDVSELQRVSELTGMSVESIQLLEQAMKDAGMNVNIDTPLSALQRFKETAQESADQLTRLGLTDMSFDIDSTDLDSINSQITEVQSILDGMRNEDGTINMELAGADEALTVLGALEAEKLSLEYPTLMSVDVNSSTAEGDLNMLLGLLQSFAATDATAKLGIDDGQAQADADALLAQIQSMEAVIPADLNLDTTSADSLLASLQSLDPSVFVTYFANTEDTDAEDAKSDGGNRTTTYTPDTGLIDAVNAVTYGGTRTVTYTPNTQNLPTYFSSITRYVNYVARGDTQAYGTARASGTAHARGTAMAHGYWGTKNSGVALGGELGTELLVRDGHYYTIGENGAGFFNYKKGDIIFNAEQTEQIFKYGRIKYGKNRGNALATGTAFDSGSGGKRRRKPTSTVSAAGSSSKSSSYKSSSTYNGNKTASSKASSSADDFAEDLDWIEVLIDRIERSIKNLASVASSAFKSLTTRTSALGDEIAAVSQEIDYQNQAYDEYMNAAETISLSESYKALVRSGKINLETITDKELNESISKYKELYEKALDARDAVVELHESMSQLYEDNFNNIQEDYNHQLSLYEHLTTTYENGIEQLEQKGYLISTEYYTALSNVEKQNISILNKQLDEMVDAMSEALNTGAVEMYSSSWYEMQENINGVKEAIDEANTSLLEYAKTMREIQWGYFDFVQDRISQLTQESNFLIDLLDRDELFDDGGKLTNAGMATMGLHGQNYNVLMAQADQYRDEMLKVNKQLAQDPYNTEILERREELLKLQQESISAAEDERDAIISLVHDGIDKQLSSLKDLISAYTDSMDSASSLYDYQKKISEQSKNIASLEKQLSAYGNDTSEEGRLNVQKLRSSLEDARSDLEETQYDRYISDQKKLLDDLYDDYEKVLNERFDNVDTLLSDVIAVINAFATENGGGFTSVNEAMAELGENLAVDLVGEDTSSIRNTLLSTADSVGYRMTQGMSDIWTKITGENGPMAVMRLYGEGFTTSFTTINDVLRKIAEKMGAIKAQSDTVAKAKVQSTTTTTAAKTPAKTTTTATKSSTPAPAVTKQDQVTSDTIAKIAEAIWIYGSSATGWGTAPYRVQRINSKYPAGTGEKVQDYINAHYNELYAAWVKRGKPALSAYPTFNSPKYKSGGLIDFTGPAWVDGSSSNPESILSAADTKNFIALRDSLRALSTNKSVASVPASVASAARLASNANRLGGGVSIGELNIPIDHVENYDDFVAKLQQKIQSKEFERFIQSITVDRINGGSALAKTKYSIM